MVCLYPGSFDPVTLGHMDMIRRASMLFEKVYVGILHNPDKQGCFSVEERMHMLRESCAGFANVKVVAYAGLTVDLAKQLQARVLLRGVRGNSDLESEMTLYRVNSALEPEIETVFLPAAKGMEDISSSIVRQLAIFKGNADMFLPPAAAKMVREKFSR